MQQIHLRNIPPPMETFDHIKFLVSLATWIKPESYLEIGVRDGKSLKEIAPICKKCYGVDIKLMEKDFDDNVILFEMSSDDFLDQNKDLKFDFVFIDGDHKKNQVIKDFINVSKKVIEDGFICFHDTYPYCESLTIDKYCSNAWEAILEIKKNYSKDWEILTLPFNPGLTIMKKISMNKQVAWK